jgi:hypothetical protein
VPCRPEPEEVAVGARIDEAGAGFCARSASACANATHEQGSRRWVHRHGPAQDQLVAGREFSALMVDAVPNLHHQDSGQSFPRFIFEPVEDQTSLLAEDADGAWERVDNISEQALAQFPQKAPKTRGSRGSRSGSAPVRRRPSVRVRRASAADRAGLVSMPPTRARKPAAASTLRMRRARSASDSDCGTLGSLSLCRSLLQADLVDRYPGRRLPRHQRRHRPRPDLRRPPRRSPQPGRAPSLRR